MGWVDEEPMRRLTALRLFAGSQLLGLCYAQEPTPAPAEWLGGAPYQEWTRATGDWGGLRTWCEDRGIEFGGGYTGDLAAPWSGGLRSRSSLSSLWDINVAADLDTMFGLPRTLLYVDAYQIEGRDPTTDIGDLQGVSNIQATDIAQIAEVWLETWVGDQFRVKLGKVDFNSEFAFNEIGGEFINSSAAIVPTIVGYPIYPNPAMSVNAFYTPQENLYVGFGVYDGSTAEGIPTGNRGPSGFFGSDDADSYFYALECGGSWTGGERWGSGRAALGVWHHSADFDRFDGGTESGTSGVWLTLEQHLWRENPRTEGDEQGLGVFFSAGHADDSVSTFGSTVVLGAHWIGPLARRDHDSCGLAVLWADLSDDPSAGLPGDETVFEAFYKIAVTPSIRLKPDFQYIRDPGGDETADDVLVAMLRLEVMF